ncbi:hypothetical protein DQG13_19760 [Paenibacillus sp. YN15]|nr:hypothetical protein DQG13_19760 [Paenibacillus sp. YN15]
MDALHRNTNAIIPSNRRKLTTLSHAISLGRQLAYIKRTGAADHIGGYAEWIALAGYTRQQADRLVALYDSLSAKEA